MKLFSIPILAALLSSCASETPQKNNEQASIQTSKVDSSDLTDPMIDENSNQSGGDGLTEENKNALKPYLQSNQITRLSNAVYSIGTSNSDINAIQSFETIVGITDTLKNIIIDGANYETVDENGEYYPFTLRTELASLEEVVPGFTNSCIAECTEYDCWFYLAPYLELAKKTNGSADDEFFEALSIGYGERMTTAHTFKAWFAQMWDYGGATLLGNGIHLDFLTKAKHYNENYQVGNKLMNKLIKSAYDDINHGIYMNSPEKVTEEMRAIIELKVFSEDKNENLSKFATQIENGNMENPNSGGSQLQFNCETGDCDFGG